MLLAKVVRVCSAAFILMGMAIMLLAASAPARANGNVPNDCGTCNCPGRGACQLTNGSGAGCTDCACHQDDGIDWNCSAN
jgi:hypothetical protein